MAASHDKRKARATSASAEGLVIYDLDDDGPRRLTDHFIAVVASHMQEGQHGRDEHLCLLPAALGVHEAHVDTLEKAELIETRHAGTWSIEPSDLCVVPDWVRDLCCDAVAARKALEGKVEANWQEPAVDEDPFGSKRQSLPLNERGAFLAARAAAGASREAAGALVVDESLGALLLAQVPPTDTAVPTFDKVKLLLADNDLTGITWTQQYAVLCDVLGSENTPEQKIGVLDFLYSCDKFVIAVPAPLPQPLQLVCAAFSVGQPGLADVVRCMLALGAPPPGNLHTDLAHLALTPATGY